MLVVSTICSYLIEDIFINHMASVHLPIVLYVKAIYSRSMAARVPRPYTFPISSHTLWIVRQLIKVSRGNNIDEGEEFYIKSFNGNYPPSIESNHFTYEILRYLMSQKIIDIHYGDSKGIKEYTIPIKGKPTQSMVSEWLVSIENISALITFYNKLVYHIKLIETERKNILQCHFYVSDDAVLWMESDIGRYPIHILYHGLVAYRVMSTLCQFGIVELDEKGEIKGTGEFAGTVVKSLQDTLHGVGFDKTLKDHLFIESTKNKLSIKMPSIPIQKDIHQYLIEHFAVAKFAVSIDSPHVQKRKSLQRYSFQQVLERKMKRL